MSKIAAIVGGGVIGGGWAARFLLNGWDVRVFDPDPEAPRKVSEVLARARRSLPMLYDVAMPSEGEITYCTSLEDAVTGATWVQESVPESLELKRKVLQGIGEFISPDAFIGSSTSGFTPTALQEGHPHPDRVVVTHPFVPVYLLPVVELVGSSKNASEDIEKAQDILRSVGMYPLRVRAEIDAHIADRLLEAVWRESLWLVKDGIATTEEIDNAIRYGFGLRWAQMGLFETYRIGGGEAGMAHFLAQFGPALKWPWTKLMDVPELTDELVKTIADQSDAQANGATIADLEARRDRNLVVILRALRQQDQAAGKLLLEHEENELKTPLTETVPMVTVRRVVPVDWTDYNGHMNEGRYGQVFSDAADAIMRHVGADLAYIDEGNSYFTAETNVTYLAETHAADPFVVETRVIQGEGKKLRLFHEMRREHGGELLATCDQFMLHVSLETRKSCPPRPEVLARVEALAKSHAEA
ncbi:carnitine 3-dehydrogenase [Mesobacterium pallidum]|uniref:carnitine 3-dehydrogenase n=1 Tax=Mesobacterium pallidum TaxID=2872037 RepID=UPI001EE1BA10|nr:carnitine 3-dehydrogenase [Mesobacterium pallidum]